MKNKMIRLMALLLTCTIILCGGGYAEDDDPDDVESIWPENELADEETIWTDTPERRQTEPAADDETEDAQMAKVVTWLSCDLQKTVQAQGLNGNVFSLDNNGNRICVRIFSNGQKTTVSGSVTANCILADDSTVNVNGGLMTDNGQSVAYVDIPQGVLLIPGALRIAIKLTSGSEITTLAAIVTTVYRTKTDNVITPSQQIINDWNAQISAAIAGQDAAIAAQDAKITDLKSAINKSVVPTIEYNFENIIGVDYKNNLLDPRTATIVSRFQNNVSFEYDGLVSFTPQGNGDNIVNIYVPVENGKSYKFNFVDFSQMMQYGYKFANSIGSWTDQGFDRSSAEAVVTNQGSSYLCLYLREPNTFSGAIRVQVFETEQASKTLLQAINEKVQYKTGKNLLDRNTDNKLSGKYVDYTSGRVGTNATFTAFAMPIIGGLTISTNFGNTHIAFFEEYLDDITIYANGTIPGYISGAEGRTTPLTGISIPNNAKMLIASINKDSLEGFPAQIEYGDRQTEPVPYSFGIDGKEVNPRSVSTKAIDNEGIVFYLKADGTGDFSNLRTCIEAIGELNEQYDHITIKLSPGIYDIRSYYTTEEWMNVSFIGLTVPHDVSLIGIGGKKEDIIITCTSESNTSRISTLNFTYNIECENITFYGENLRYVIHDDYSPYEIANHGGEYRTIRNCDFIGKNMVLDWVYGEGTKGGSKHVFEQVRFINLTSHQAYSTHDLYNGEARSSLSEIHIFRNCEFIGASTGNGNLRLCPGTGGVSQTVVLEGCILKSIYINSSSTGGNNATTVYDIVGSGNSENIRLDFYYSQNRKSKPRFGETVKAGINKSGSTINAGDYCKIGNNGIIVGTQADNIGIALFDSVDNSVVYYQ